MYRSGDYVSFEETSSSPAVSGTFLEESKGFYVISVDSDGSIVKVPVDEINKIQNPQKSRIRNRPEYERFREDNIKKSVYPPTQVVESLGLYNNPMNEDLDEEIWNHAIDIALKVKGDYRGTKLRPTDVLREYYLLKGNQITDSVDDSTFERFKEEIKSQARYDLNKKFDLSILEHFTPVLGIDPVLWKEVVNEITEGSSQFSANDLLENLYKKIKMKKVTDSGKLKDNLVQISEIKQRLIKSGLDCWYDNEGKLMAVTFINFSESDSTKVELATNTGVLFEGDKSHLYIDAVEFINNLNIPYEN